ncbi:hypothetical protein DSL72_002743 [Monilinia vaccinii-corymbosi]|uniref:Major facilitator superfamily (MFS) profile domain-containing protein n=1 Tax=Monilinia vaccinii-corymbosi TaxID=61207 RepID=A0A8A3PDB6_9HELO|nr:hypothetical protein DSL72_002743 [Monilinia vaccinii-corymbosi]
MASITEPQPVLQNLGYSRNEIEQPWFGSNRNSFTKMDEGNGKSDAQFDDCFDAEKDTGEWEGQKFSQGSIEDPLNWPSYRKALAFFSLCLAFSVVGMQRLMFVSVNSVIEAQFSISSTQTAALTGVAFIFSASSPLWEMLSMKVGKRSILIFASMLMLAGSLWNMHVEGFWQFLGGRMFQGLGWGAFEGLGRRAVGDMYFESQIPACLMILSIIDLAFTWGTPIIGGYLSQTIGGYGNQIMLMTIFQAISMFLFIVLFPETAFSRSDYPAPSTSIPPTSSFKSWLKTLHVMPYWGNPSKVDLLKPLKGFSSPTTILTFVLSSLPIAAAYAFALSLSGFLSASPLFIFPTQMGYIFLGPLLLSIIPYLLLSIMSPTKQITATSTGKNSGNSTRSAFRIAIPGLILFATGTVFFSKYVSTTVIANVMGVDSNSAFVTSDSDTNLNLRVVGLLLGLMVAGGAVVSFAVQRYLGLREAQMGRERGEKGHLERAHHVLLTIFTGIVVIAMPRWVDGGVGQEMGGVMGLKDTGFGLGAFGFIVGLVAVIVLWVSGDRITGWEMGEKGKGKGKEEEFVYKIKQLQV